MVNLGNWTTIDCPTKKQEEALEYLRNKMDGYARVRKVMNPHDLGEYPSFEIDMDSEFVNHNPDVEECSIECELCIKKDKIEDKLNEVEKNYNNKFEKWL